MVRSFPALNVDCKCFFHDLIGSLFYALISHVPASVVYTLFHSKRFFDLKRNFFSVIHSLSTTKVMKKTQKISKRTKNVARKQKLMLKSMLQIKLTLKSKNPKRKEF